VSGCIKLDGFRFRWIAGPHRRAACAALFAVLQFLAAAPAQADYIVQRGDVIEVTVAGVPGLHRRVAIDMAGRLSLPVVGEVEAAGKSLSQLTATLSGLLVAKNIARDPEVTMDVAEYRPVYVNGDVGKPGAYPYRPGMSVRDAVSLAEGYDPLHLHGRDPMLEAADARGDYESYAVELAKQAIRIARIKAELANRRNLDLTSLANLPIRPAVETEIAQSETRQLTADSENLDREKAYLTEMIKGTQDQLAALTNQQQQGAADASLQGKNLARARDLMQRGWLSMARLEDNQRAAAAAQSQLSDVQTRAAQARKDLEDLARKLQTTDDQRRIQLLQELSDATAQFATARFRFEAAAEKVRLTSGGQLRNASVARLSRPDVTIYRKVNGTDRRIKADEDTSLEPGDNVEINTEPPLKKMGAEPKDGGQLPLADAAAAPRLYPSLNK
jgi:polysaccharide export outer membrane protein